MDEVNSERFPNLARLRKWLADPRFLHVPTSQRRTIMDGIRSAPMIEDGKIVAKIAVNSILQDSMQELTTLIFEGTGDIGKLREAIAMEIHVLRNREYRTKEAKALAEEIVTRLNNALEK